MGCEPIRLHELLLCKRDMFTDTLIDDLGENVATIWVYLYTNGIIRTSFSSVAFVKIAFQYTFVIDKQKMQTLKTFCRK